MPKPKKSKRATKSGESKARSADQNVSVAGSAATANAHYDPDTDTVTLNKGPEEITIRPCNPTTEPEAQAANFADLIRKIRVAPAPPGVNTEVEAVRHLRAHAEDVDAVWIPKSYVGIVAPLSELRRPDGSVCYTGTATLLRETDGAGDVSLALVDSRTGKAISRRLYAWFLRVNGRVFEQRPRLCDASPAELVGEYEGAPAAVFPKAIPFKVIPSAATSVDYVLEESLVREHFPFLAWRVSFRGYVFGNPPARFATNVATWAYLETVVDDKDCLFEMRGATVAFHVGTWPEVCEARKRAEEDVKRKQKEDAEKMQRDEPDRAEAQLERAFAKAKQ